MTGIVNGLFGLTVLLLLVAGITSVAQTMVWPEAEWATDSPVAMGLDEELLAAAREYALSGGGSGLIIFRGKNVMAWGDLNVRYDLKSTTKSFGAAALGLAIGDGKLRLEEHAAEIHPTLGVPPEQNKSSGWLDEITLFHLAAQTAGFEKPGGYTPLLFRPGTQWDYSDSGPNWLAECLTLVYGRDLNELMFDRVFGPIGIGRMDLTWRKHAYRPDLIEGIKQREFGSGIHANVKAMARFGYLHLRRGVWNGRRILPAEFIEVASRPLPSSAELSVRSPDEYGRASAHYGLLWWNNGDGTLAGVPRDAYWSWGLYDSLIWVVPSLDLVVARAGKSWARKAGADHYEVLRPFFEPIVKAVAGQGRVYPPSSLIKGVIWAPTDTIVREAHGSDNWPLTWAEDDQLYTAYGDGRGFEPFVSEKLSLGLAKVAGAPPHIEGSNLLSSTIERKGDGARGGKASGLLMVDRVLYLWMRNATNSQLHWSSDRGRGWTACEWRFTESFGYPTFLNFGKNYRGARDEFVYIYSHDADSAYEPSDHMILARAPKSSLRERTAYEFFGGLDPRGQPKWVTDLGDREPVFSNPVRCYRSGITYNPGLKRYFWCQVLPGEDPRFKGGLGIYDAPEPWGPWTTAFFADEWDVGPGETCSFPVKWMSQDGLTLHLVFSGDDCFSVRQARVILR